MFPSIGKENHREENCKTITVSVYTFSWPAKRYHALCSKDFEGGEMVNHPKNTQILSVLPIMTGGASSRTEYKNQLQVQEGRFLVLLVVMIVLVVVVIP